MKGRLRHFLDNDSANELRAPAVLVKLGQAVVFFDRERGDALSEGTGFEHLGCSTHAQNLGQDYEVVEETRNREAFHPSKRSPLSPEARRKKRLARRLHTGKHSSIGLVEPRLGDSFIVKRASESESGQARNRKE